MSHRDANADARPPEEDRVHIALESQTLDTTTSHAHLPLDTQDPLAAGREAVSEIPTPSAIGRYRIDEVLGKGGFGVVYRAWDTLLERTVAVKVPHRLRHPEVDAASAFLSEARLAARVRHPGIVVVHDSGVEPDGLCYVVFEFVQGKTLAATMRERRLPLREGVQMLAQVAQALHVAHKSGLVHRDLKPANILIDADGRARVSDFGLAVDEATQQARTHDYSGTPHYMAPEQVRGEAHRMDGRTDIWSLGVMLYEILTGRRPFNGPDSLAVFDEIQHREPKPPRQISDHVPRELERIALGCLAKNITQRYLTAADVAEELQAWLDQSGGNGSAAALAAGVPATPRGANTKWLAALGALAACAVVAYGLYLWSGGGTAGTKEAANGSPGASNDKGTTRPSAEGDSSQPIVFQKLPLAEQKQRIWYPLLASREYARPIWPARDANSEMIPQPAQQQLRLDASDWALVELGRIQSPGFKLQIELYQNPWEGNVGVYWGFRPAGDSGDTQFQALILGSDDPPDQVARNWSLRQYRVLAPAAGPVRTVELSRAPITHPGLQPRVLELTVKQGRADSIRWDGTPLARTPSSEPVDASTEAVGFGILSNGGAAVFRSGQVMLTY